MKRKTFIFIILIVLNFHLFCVIEEIASFKGFLYGNAPECEYDNWISHIVEGIAAPGYNVYAPYDRQTDDFGNFIIPTDTMLIHWENAVLQFVSGNLEQAQDTLDLYEIPYNVVIFYDTDTGRTYHILREILNMQYYDDNGTNNHYDDEMGSFDNGWGLYIHYPDGPFPHITTAPHSCDDYPSIPLAYKIFVDQQSKFLCISGVGREVAWTHDGDYSNSKSLSDPTRAYDHPFNTCYRRFCDKMREEFGRREFSLQMHSFDWGNSHWGYPDVQISGGYQVASPDLPIRDHSSHKKDIINATDFCVHPANSIGIHDPVFINDFYGIHYSKYSFDFSDNDTTFAVRNHTDLWGYGENRQMQYTQSGFSHYDNFEPFFHIEFDELPNIYPQNLNNYYWFNGWDAASQTWNFEERFDRPLQYYSPWIDALTEVLPDMFQMDDNEIPDPPADFRIITENSDKITLKWTPGDCYDIDSYEILFAEEPIGEDNFTIRDRTNDGTLATLAEDQHSIAGLEQGQDYYFQLRIRDKNGNYSDVTEEIIGITGPAIMSNFTAYGRDNSVDLGWYVPEQNNCLGFNIYRRTADSENVLIDSWETNPELHGINLIEQTYTAVDSEVVNGLYYIYQTSAVDTLLNEYFYGSPAYASPQKVFEIFARQEFGVFADTCFFGMNPYASDGYDNNTFDFPTSDSLSGDYFFCEFYEENWENVPTKFEQEIYSQYDPRYYSKRWIFRFRTNQTNQTVEIGINNPNRNFDRLYLLRSGSWTNLAEDTYMFIPGVSNYYTFDLYYGNLTPDVNFTNIPNQLLYPNEVLTIDWSLDFANGIDHLNIYAENSEITIPIQTGFSPDISELDWIVPPLLFEDLKLKLDVFMLEGDTLTYFSPYKFGIVTPQTIVETYQGWKLITQNIDASFPEEIYGEGALFYEYFENEFSQIIEPEFLQPYWIFTPQDNYFVVNNAEIRRVAYDHQMVQGWNIIPNPHRANYELGQIQFVLEETVFEYYEAIQNRLIEPNLYKYDERFVPVYDLQPSDAYYLYCYEDGIKLRFIPYNAPIYSPDFEYEWLLEINAKQSGAEGSSVVVGTSSQADSLYDPVYDLLKPLDIPFDSVLSFRIPFAHNDETYDLHQSLTHPQDTSGNFHYEWNGEIDLPSLDPVNFNVIPENLPENHRIYLEMPDGIYELFQDEARVYDPADTLLEFVILITDEYFSDVEDESIPKQVTLRSYPNPFNPTGNRRNSQTSIVYSIPENGKIDLSVYNIKGQKVVTLANEAKEKGLWKQVWNGRDENEKTVSSGVYFYKLDVNGQTKAIRKCLLLK